MHDPAQKRRIIKTLDHTVKTVSDPDHLQDELKRLTTVPSANGYKSNDIKRAINRRRTVVTPTTAHEETDAPSTCLPYIHMFLLKRKGIKTILSQLAKYPRN